MSRPDHERRRAYLELLNIPYCPCRATKTQARFLLDRHREVLYGGAAGGGKSVAMLMAALQFIEVPGYSAIIFRPSLTDLKLPSGLISVSHEWLSGRATWNGDTNTWTFPNGARLQFGYLATASDKYRYQGAEFQYIGFDELTQFREEDYIYLFSRLRGPSDPKNPLSRVPLRMRCTTNPGGPGHDWVRARFIAPYYDTLAGAPADPDRRFHPARIIDNPHLDVDAYIKNLSELSVVERERLLNGDWDIRPDGGIFRRDWFTLINPADVPGGLELLRSWDLAATADRPGADPDWTVGALIGRDERTGIYYLLDIVRLRGTALEVEQTIQATAERDGRDVKVIIEEEGGSAGKAISLHYRTQVLEPYSVRFERPTGDKPTRAQPTASKAEAGLLHVVRGRWLDDFLDEIEIFPLGRHDDQVDALTQGVNWLAAHGQTPLVAPICIPRSYEYGQDVIPRWLEGGPYDDDDDVIDLGGC